MSGPSNATCTHPCETTCGGTGIQNCCLGDSTKCKWDPACTIPTTPPHYRCDRQRKIPKCVHDPHSRNTKDVCHQNCQATTPPITCAPTPATDNHTVALHTPIVHSSTTPLPDLPYNNEGFDGGNITAPNTNWINQHIERIANDQFSTDQCPWKKMNTTGKGACSPNATDEIANTVFWPGTAKSVYQATGFTPEYWTGPKFNKCTPKPATAGSSNNGHSGRGQKTRFNVPSLHDQQKQKEKEMEKERTTSEFAMRPQRPDNVVVEEFANPPPTPLQDRTAQNLVNETRYWKSRGHQGVLRYNVFTNNMLESLRGAQHSNLLLDKNTQDMYTNRDTIKQLDSSIYSFQRQAEVGNDFARRQNQTLFLVKLFLTYMLVLLIPLLIKRSMKDSFKNSYVGILCLFITVPFLYILGWNLYSVRSRSNMRWPLRNWAMDQHPGPDDPTPTPTPACTKSSVDEERYEQEMKNLLVDMETIQEDINNEKARCVNYTAGDNDKLTADQKKLAQLVNAHPKAATAAGIHNSHIDWHL